MSEPSNSVHSGGHSERGDSSSPGATEDKGSGDHPPPRKRQRVRLSCLECRRRKLSCDREFPCSRCFQSGTPDRCEYETRPGLAPFPNKLGLSQTALSLSSGFTDRLSLPLPGAGGGGGVGSGIIGGGDHAASYFRRDSAVRGVDHDRIRRLELEVAQLKGLLQKQASSSLDGSTVNTDQSPANVHHRHQKPEVEAGVVTDSCLPTFLQYQEPGGDKDELRFFRGKEFKTRYFGPHSACLAFSELTGLCPFMKETAEEWLRPLHIHNKKDRSKGKEERERKFHQPDPSLEALLPSKGETDALVSIYLDQFEQVHRIVHIPSFRREYAKFWDPAETRTAAFTVLVLCVMGISSCLDEHVPHKFEKMVSNSHANALKWIEAAEAWQERQSQKHRRLIHYQIACLIYLAKRVNTMKKKRFWKGAGAMTQDAISVGLHREPSHMSDKISPFNQEMRRRIWATIQDFDMQASFDHGLPTLLSSLHYDVNPPRNIDDDEFDEDTKELPPSRPPTDYTFSSYQHLSRQSLPLRLELSRVLTGPPEDLDYDQVIRYTNEISQEIDSLPSWDCSVNNTPGEAVVLKKPLLAYTLLHVQLRQYIIPLHQPYLRLRKSNSKYQYSEIIYYNAARDMVLLNDKLHQLGVRTLNFLREDNLTLAINLCSVTMLQPTGSTNMIMINSQHTLQLLEKCLSMKEDRILRCGNNEPWGYSIMCAAVGLLEAHLGTKTSEAAKAGSAERFINLHYKLLAGQDPPMSSMPSSSQQSEQQGRYGGGGIGPGGNVGVSAGAYPLPPSGETFVRSKSVTPFLPGSQGSGSAAQVAPGLGAGVVDGIIPGTPLPWWLPNADAPGMPGMPVNPDFSLELLGFNLNELWGGAELGDWDQS
ncbi:multidrug resistance regulator 1 [Diplogelasinospora grovesii]|uniref:Multidrug resistance regulator 1 n=1 Tax=Diplogelasinospora grovesii TaxID=303347 RepID=A0AAN6S6I9_9PEZI|nr:multidrug resistance regulator 1 [Diplogelasinospora grovesii]